MPVPTAFRTLRRSTTPLVICLGILVSYAVSPVGASAAPSRATAVSWAASVMRAINAERAGHSLPALLARTPLDNIAHNHNVKMAAYDRSSHQLPGELPYRSRIGKAGYSASTAGENLGVTADITAAGVSAVRRAMYTEHWASDWSRDNILSRSFRYFGVDIAYDAVHHKLWVTEEFTTNAPVAARTASSMANTMLSLLNAERAQHGLAALRLNAGLSRSAHGHNLRMASNNLMSHLLPGEPSFLSRILGVGYHLRAAGENIGWTTDRSVNGALYLQRLMYNEVPPNDAHRINILSKTYREVGVDVYIDSPHGKLWITQDLGLAA